MNANKHNSNASTMKLRKLSWLVSNGYVSQVFTKGKSFCKKIVSKIRLSHLAYIYLLSLLFPPLIPREEVKGNVSQRCSLFSSLSPSLSLCQAVSSTRIPPSSWRGFWLRARTLLSYWINMYFACIDTMAVPRVAFSWIIHWGWINF